jgi:hypothetical protein
MPFQASITTKIVVQRRLKGSKAHIFGAHWENKYLNKLFVVSGTKVYDSAKLTPFPVKNKI